MSKSSKYIHLLSTGDLIFIASSRHIPTDWADVALYIDGEVLHTIHLGDGSSKVIKRSTAEFIEYEGRPTALFRLDFASTIDRKKFAYHLLEEFVKPLTWWQSIFMPFKKISRVFDWTNHGSIRLRVLSEFNSFDLKNLEQQGSLVRLL